MCLDVFPEKRRVRKAKEQLSDNAELLKIRMQKAWNDVEESYQQSCDKYADAYAGYQNKLLEYRQAVGQ